jgi:acetyl-CoA synthetase
MRCGRRPAARSATCCSPRARATSRRRPERSTAAQLAGASAAYAIAATAAQDPLCHFTSGTTGTPKGALHVHGAAVAHHATARYALDFHPGDVFWCTAGPGWITGASYGIVAPLLHGLTLVVDEAELEAKRWYAVLAQQRMSAPSEAELRRTLVETLQRVAPDADADVAAR